MSYIYKNPISTERVNGAQWSVLNTDVIGTNYSVFSTGGYMEVWSLDDLKFTDGGQSSGTIFYSGNTIPVWYTKSANPSFVGNSLQLEADGISTGRRKLGMLVYVHETNLVYQYTIPNYETLFNNADAEGSIQTNIDPNSNQTISYIVKDRSNPTLPWPNGGALIDAWLDNSIEGVSGATAQTARWKVFWGTDWQVTGGTIDYNSTGDLNLNSNSGNTVTISGLKTITGGTYFSGTSTIELYNNLGDTISITGITGGSGGSGSSGSSGTSGSSGSSGTSGSSGSSGTSGSSGSSGTSGSSGSSGTSGSSGSSGTSGSSGSSGTSGSSGSSGTSGNSFTGGTVNYDTNGRFTLESDDRLDDINVDGFKTITGGTYLSASTTLELYNNLSETIEITGFTSGGGTDISVSANTGLGIIDPNTLYTIYNSTLSGSLEMDEDVGGLTTGTRVDELTGKTFVQLFDDLLFPTALPTYTIPTIALNGLPSSQTLEVGSSKAIAVNGYGVKNDAGDFTSLRIRTGTTTPNVDVVVDNSPTPSNVSDIPDQFGFTNPNNPNSGFTSTQLAYTLIVPPPLAGQTSSSTKYDAEGDCNAGQAKLDNKGVTDTRTAGTNANTPQAARTDLNASDRTITGIYPYFWGVSSTQPTVSSIVNEIQNGTANKVLSSASGSFTITFNASSEFLWFAHFAEYNDKTTWYVDGNNNGTIGSKLFDNPQVSSVDSPDTYWTNINFDIYISYYATTTVGGMTFS